jgi:hypothetical protein
MVDIVYEFPITEAFILNVRQSKERRLLYAEQGGVIIIQNFSNY